MSDKKEMTEKDAEDLKNLLFIYDNDVIAKAIFNSFSSVKWSNSLGLELIRLAHTHLFE